MGKERGETGRYVETAPLDAVLAVFEQVRGPVVSSADVADALDCSTDTARRKLAELHREGRVERRETAGRVVWWRVAGDDAGGEGNGRGATDGDVSRSNDAESDAAVDLADLGLAPDQRAAVAAMYEHLRDAGTAQKADFIRDVYPDHDGPYTSPGGWWNALGTGSTTADSKGALGDLPGVEKPDRGPTWQWVGE